MKYGRLVYGRNRINTENQFGNLGDCFQTFAIDNLYKLAGILENQIVSLKREFLSEYKGEKVLLPMQGWFGLIKGMTDIYPLSNDILPLYIGYHCVSNKQCRKMICFLKSASNDSIFYIGCRDFETYRKMKNLSISLSTYLSGCLTLTLPTRILQKDEKPNKVFCVDIPTNLKNYIPKEYLANIECITHELAFTDETLEKEAYALLKRYEKEAKLVITSRLHCATVCLALGIPVILAREYFDDRYGFINRYLRLYTPELFSKIDWYPKVVNLDDEKQKLVDLFVSLIKNQNDEKLAKSVHNLYEPFSNIKLRTPLKTRLFRIAQESCPSFVDFMREKVLYKFSVATGRNNKEM